MGDPQKETIRLAFSIYSSPGSCALLLGSGVSKSAKIMTGWEVMLDLIQKIADISGEKPEDLSKWYKEKFNGEDPTYDNLLDRIAHKSVERRNILSEYFDPTPEYIEAGQRIPQPAHKSIAKLVKNGYVKIILTTNFDRLLETALLMEGIHPYLICSDDAIDGCLPPAHIRESCIIYKIHGDYKDTRLRNTPDELKEYPEKVNKYLDRIFEDFGIIVCGWSADWDVALRKALCNKRGDRFGLYWTAISEPKGVSKEIIDKLHANFISISGADNFFVTLEENIEALQRHKYPKDPLTTPLAIEKTKKFIAENNSAKIFDLVNNERLAVYSEISSDDFEIDSSKLSLRGIQPNEQLYVERFNRCEQLIKPLCGICSTIAYFDDENYGKIILPTMENLIYNHQWSNCNTILLELENYPLYLLNNVIGVTALTNNHYKLLSSVLLKPRHVQKNIRGEISKKPIVASLCIWNLFSNFSDKYAFDPTKPDEKIIVYNHVYDFIFSQVEGYIPNKLIFIEELQKYKFLSAMVLVDIGSDEPEKNSFSAYLREVYALEYFKGKSTWPGMRTKLDKKPILDFIYSGQKLGNDWGLIKAGFFGGNIERFNECFTVVSNHKDWLGE
jgi:hypothetical protein